MAKLRITVINDDDNFLQLVRELLGDEGYDVTTCKEWEQAHSHVLKAKPDLIIQDLLLGRPDTGWKILETLTLDPRTRSIPIIVCSAAKSELAERGADLAGKGIQTLLKPFDLEDLLLAIRRTLGPSTTKR